MTTEEQECFEQAAWAAWVREQDDLARGVRILEDRSLDYDAMRDQLEEQVGAPLEVTIVPHLEILLTTGGPAMGYDIELDSDYGTVRGCFWYQNWFQERRRFWLDSERLDQVLAIYAIDPAILREPREGEVR